MARTPGKPESRNPKYAERVARRTEDNLTPKMRHFRDAFIAQYVQDFDARRAYAAAGGSSRAAATKSYEMLREPYVSQRIYEITRNAEEDAIVTRSEILTGLKREAYNFGVDNDAKGRIAAWSRLAKLRGMEVDKQEVEHSVKGGVMLVPVTANVDDWEAATKKAQGELKRVVRE